jgi:hypothetical protein
MTDIPDKLDIVVISERPMTEPGTPEATTRSLTSAAR